jgi:hypothetical protein
MLLPILASGQMYLDSYRFAGAVTPLLDDYGTASAAYSLRLLRTAYTGDCITVRRSSDSVLDTFGFVNNYLDTTALKTFCSGTNCFVRIWFDQSGNGRNASQTTSGYQPQIVSNGNVIYEGSQVAIDFDGTDDFLQGITKDASLTNGTHAWVLKPDVTNANQRIIEQPTSNGNILLISAGGNYEFSDYQLTPSVLASIATVSAATSKTVIIGFIGTGLKTAKIWKNNAAGTDGTQLTGTLQHLNTAETNIRFGILRNSISSAFNGKAQEYVRWDTDRSADVSGINSNINSYYSIY